jgi:hypothetical protein
LGFAPFWGGYATLPQNSTTPKTQLTKALWAKKYMSSIEDKIRLIPNLLELSGRDYDKQESLVAEYRKKLKPFIYSMPERHMDYCTKCEYQECAVGNTLEIPYKQPILYRLKNALGLINGDIYSHVKSEKITFYNLSVHKWMCHGERYPENLMGMLDKAIAITSCSN